MSQSRIPIPRRQIKELCQHYHVRRLALFGSVFRDDFRTDSDVDVLVLFKPDARFGFMTLGHMKRELSTLFQRPVDLVPQEGLKPIIRESVLSSAEEVYAV